MHKPHEASHESTTTPHVDGADGEGEGDVDVDGGAGDDGVGK